MCQTYVLDVSDMIINTCIYHEQERTVLVGLGFTHGKITASLIALGAVTELFRTGLDITI